MPSDQYVIALTTFPADGNVEGFARALVEQKVAACVNILPPMVSIYRWQGAVEKADERQLVIKTTAASIPALEAATRKLHPYEVPEFVVLPIQHGSADYLSWLSASTTFGA